MSLGSLSNSLQGKVWLAYSGDPSLRQPPGPFVAPDGMTDAEAIKEATAARAAEQKQYAEDLQRCRETGDWSSLTIPGEKPTLFRFQFPTGKARARLWDRVKILAGSDRTDEAAIVFFLATVREVVGTLPGHPSYEVKVARDEETGLLMAQEELAAMFDDTPVVLELGNAAFARFKAVPGK